MSQSKEELSLVTELSAEYQDDTDMPLPSPSGPAFPQELLDLIIDMACDDKPTLRACALASSQLLPRCQMHLHRVLKLGSLAACEHATDIYRNSFLVRHVREVHVYDRSHRDSDDRDQSWVDANVPAVLAKLKASVVETVHINNIQNIHWAACEDVLFPSATCLVLHRTEFQSPKEFTKHFKHFPCLGHLVVRELSFTQKVGHPSILGPRPPLHTLEIRSGTSQEFILNWLLYQPAGKIRIRTLAYSVERWQIKAPKEALKVLGSTVKDLTIVFPYESPHYLLKDDPLLSYLKSIHSLAFDFVTFYASVYGSPSMPMLLQRITSPHITRLSFRFSLDSQYTGLDDSLVRIARIRLHETNELLGRLAPFAGLAAVRIEVRSNEWTKLLRLRTLDAWIRSDVEQHRVRSERKRPEWRDAMATPQSGSGSGSQGVGVGVGSSTSPKASEYCCSSSSGGAGSSGGVTSILSVEEMYREHQRMRNELEGERLVVQRAECDFSKAVETWKKARTIFDAALPYVGGQEILTVEPMGYDPPEELTMYRRPVLLPVQHVMYYGSKAYHYHDLHMRP
ncbi:uncharacterized protein LAESUDRAFT_810084 [Laetiporus sulphureus 93-53]|uniref:Uncharacterized protein n=1 Tax=Laetiporus sulphureus 93-53 TaxID=1314785 RepID=A0A165GJM7_9APHY|nr:uncharacterized protein LAESUDRAFT_810084 [Laetiporus sulphureus 93-53]KZT10444.1 hypothetical protein LAESUDRAFT_810084 [Laetiporus sulphureus 93-53]